MHLDDLIQIVRWEEAEPALRAIRTAVFIHEQHVPEAMEWDEFDAVSVHLLACDVAGRPVGTARLLPDGHIGRMAVLKAWRGQGFGSAMLRKSLQELMRWHQQKAQLNAQISAVSFYEKFGFRVLGEEFMEAGIPHIKMALSLKQH